jgi:hypothetical protein
MGVNPSRIKLPSTAIHIYDIFMLQFYKVYQIS